MTAGFYKKENNGQLSYAPNYVEGDGFVLNINDKDSYIYPVYGWRWFENEEDAKTFFQNDTGDFVTQRQFRLSLLQSGIDPDDITNMLSSNKAALIEWNFASFIDRNHPLVDQLGAVFNKTPQQLNEIFDNAKNL